MGDQTIPMNATLYGYRTHRRWSREPAFTDGVEWWPETADDDWCGEHEPREGRGEVTHD